MYNQYGRKWPRKKTDVVSGRNATHALLSLDLTVICNKVYGIEMAHQFLGKGKSVQSMVPYYNGHLIGRIISCIFPTKFAPAQQQMIKKSARITSVMITLGSHSCLSGCQRQLKKCGKSAHSKVAVCSAHTLRCHVISVPYNSLVISSVVL